MATKPKAILSTHDGREASPITKASNVLFENGQTAQDILNDRQDTMISPVIENSSSMFKVGQGDNVDYSANVVNGAYESMVLKGKSMVNCIQEPSSQDVVLPYEFADGQYVTINDTKESGALGVELKGQTLVNVLAYIKVGGNVPLVKNGNVIEVESTTENTWRSVDIDFTHLKPNTKYIVTWDSIAFSNPNFVPTSSLISVRLKTDNTQIAGWDSSRNYIIATVPSDTSDVKLRVHASQGTAIINKTTVKGLKVLEYQEGMENWNIPYFEGMTSCKMPILKTIGKNLFNESEKIEGYIDSNSTQEQLNPSVKNTWTTPWIKAKTNTSYTMQGGNRNRWQIKSRNNVITFMDKKTITTLSDTEYIRCYYCNETYTASNVQLEESSSATSYEPYKSSILSLPEEVVLRGIPNSNVHDTLNLQTGEYTQNVFEYTLNGSEAYANLTTGTWTDEYMAFLVNLDLPPFNFPRYPNRALASSTAYVEGFNYDGGVTQAVNQEGWYIGNGSSPNYLGFRIKRSRLTEYNDSPREWIRANNIRILLNIHPVTTKINLPSTLKSWNTTTHIYSEIPENTLYPILSHSNPSYPVILKPSTKYSIVANSYSNNHTNSTINFNLGGATASTTVGNRVTTITTPSTLSNELLTMSGRGNKLNNVMIIEGDVVGDEPYFEGICDCKSPILTNTGKNLFDWEAHQWRLNRFQWSHGDGGLGNGNALGRAGVEWVSIKTLKLKPSQTYYTNGYISFYENDGKGLCIDRCNHTGIFTVPTNAEIACVSAIINDGVKLEYMFDPKIIISEIEMEYEPYKSNILSANGDKIELTEDMFEQGTVSGANGIGTKYEVMKENSTVRLRSKDIIRVKPNTSYRLFREDGYDGWCVAFDSNQRYLGKSYQTETFVTDSQTHYIVPVLKNINNTTMLLEHITKFKLSEVDKTIVLRSLPNGACDTLNVETGEYVQRIGEVVLNGNNNESWDVFTGREGLKYFRIPCPKMVENNREQETPKFLIADKINFNKYSYLYQSTSIPEDVVGGTTKSSSLGVQCIYVYYKNIDVVNTFKQYLQQNPITVQYQLAVPIVKTVDLSGFPFSYENGHAILSSGSIEQSLTPKVEYSVATNRNGQIRSNQKMVERHQKQLDQLQAIILANLVNSQYNQTLTTLKYELSRV